MRVDFSPYELIAQADGRRRSGTLLRATFDDGVRGYADLHPWPELGDAPLDRQLDGLARGAPEPLAAHSLEFARLEGEGRATGRSLFENLTVPPSHASLPFGHSPAELDRVAREGYAIVKLKGWEFSREELGRFRASGLRFRLDFNARRSFDEVARLLGDWERADGIGLGWIDWLEDPCPFEAAAWQALRAHVRLAIDFEPGREAFDVRIVKPARDGMDAPRSLGPESDEGAGLALTSYLDHPIGQLGAAWVAARSAALRLPVETCGLATHSVYRENEFSRRLGLQAGRLIPPDGPGFGFTQELEALEWSVCLR